MKLKYTYFLLFPVFLIPVLTIPIMSISVMLFALGIIIMHYQEKGKNINKINFLNPWIILIIPYIIAIISTLLSDNKKNGLAHLETSAIIFVLPSLLYFFKPNISKQLLQKFKRIFIFSSILVVFLVFIFGLYFGDMMDIRSWLNEIPVIGRNPISFSYLFGIAFLMVLFDTKMKKYLTIFCGLILSAGIMLGNSKGIILPLIIICFILLFLKLKNNKHVFIVILCFTVVLLLFITQVPFFKARIVEAIENINHKPDNNHLTSTALRNGIYSCALSGIKQNFFFGVGVGDVQANLNACYQQYKIPNQDELLIGMGTHNQYLHYFLAYGVFGFLLIMGTFAFSLYIAWKSRNLLHLYLLLFTLMAMVVDEHLNVSASLCSFIFFNTLFIYNVYYFKIIKVPRFLM